MSLSFVRIIRQHLGRDACGHLEVKVRVRSTDRRETCVEFPGIRTLQGWNVNTQTAAGTTNLRIHRRKDGRIRGVWKYVYVFLKPGTIVESLTENYAPRRTASFEIM